MQGTMQSGSGKPAGQSGSGNPVDAVSGRGAARRRGALRLLLLLLAIGLVAWLLWPQVLVGYDLYRARRALTRPDLAEARGWLEAAQRRDPHRADLEYLLSAVYRRMVLFQQARTHLERARELGYPRREVERQEMMLLFQMGNVDELGPALTGLLERGGSDEVAEEVYEALVLGYFSEFRVIEAEMVLNHWLEWRPDSIQARMFRARIYTSHPDSPQLETNLREVLRIDPGHLTARLMLVDYLLSAKRVAEAQQECETCRKQAPDDPRVGIELGLYHFQMGQMGEARREIEGAIERVSDANLGMQGLITLGQIAAAEQDWQRAVEHYTRAVHLRPFDGVATYSLGTALSKLGKGDEAAKYVERYKLLAKQNEEIAEINGALVKDTANVDLRIKMAGILFEQGRKADAATWMLSALRYDPQRREAHELLAEFYEEAGKLELAQQHRDAARAGSSSSSSQESAANSVP